MPVVILAVAAAIAAALAWLARPLGPDPLRRAALADAVGAVDRELAANLELLSMFDQTHQPVVLENGEFARHRSELERDAAAAVEPVTSLYARIPETEAAMERRGPANTLKDADRRLIDAWEGDARELQRRLRAAVDGNRIVGVQAAIARLRGGSAH